MNTKKKVFIIALAVCLIAILSFSTLAWFTDSEDMTNKFLTATENDDADDVFSVDLKEYVDADGDGTPDTTPVDEGGYTYQEVLPGSQLIKNPVVTNTGKYYDEYIQVTVRLSDAAAWLAALGADYAIEDCFVGLNMVSDVNPNGDWQLVSKAQDTATDELVYVFYFVGGDMKLSPSESINLFTGVNIPTELEREDVVAMDGGFELNVDVQAIQADNTGATPAEAFALLG